MKIETKRKKEKQIVSQMIGLYCRKRHYTSSGLCSNCEVLIEYTHQRIDQCLFMETKTFCSSCKINCYNPLMRERIRDVMKFSGPRMIFYHPFIAIRHMYEMVKEKWVLSISTRK